MDRQEYLREADRCLEQVARWLATIRGAGLHRNNHMFFTVMTLAFLAQDPQGVMVLAESPFKTFQDLVDAAKPQQVLISEVSCGALDQERFAIAKARKLDPLT